MQILIPTIGSRGDVQPYIALSQGLIQAGHQPTVASHPLMNDLVVTHGVPFAPIGPDIDLAQEVAAIRHQSNNPALGLIRGMRFGFKMLEQSHEDILGLCQKADLVIVPTAIAAGKNEAELLDIPYLSVSLMPWSIPWTDPDRPLWKRIVYSTIDGLVHIITTRPLNQIRKRLGLSPVGKEGFTSTRLNLIPVSPAVYPPNPLWELHHCLVGFWFAESPGSWEPPGDLLSFLNNGDPPVLISLGAMSLGDREGSDSASLFLDAVQQAGLRAVIQGWEVNIKKMALPSNIHPCGSLPHSWLLPHCAGIVHHGGYGTTAAGLRAGIPALVIPHIADQFYWGQKVHELGVGPQPIPRGKLTLEGLTASLDELVRNITLGVTAANLGRVICSEDGIKKAVQLIEDTFT